MKTRIKIVDCFGKNRKYYPQYKGWFFWHDFVSHYGETQSIPWVFDTYESVVAFLDSKLPPRKPDISYLDHS